VISFLVKCVGGADGASEETSNDFAPVYDAIVRFKDNNTSRLKSLLADSLACHDIDAFNDMMHQVLDREDALVYFYLIFWTRVSGNVSLLLMCLFGDYRYGTRCVALRKSLTPIRCVRVRVREHVRACVRVHVRACACICVCTCMYVYIH